MVAVLLKCAEGGYVKFIELMVDRVLLGYYGVRVVRDESRKIDWNEYMSRYLSKRKVMMKTKEEEEFVLDKRTMLFQPVAVVARGRGKSDDDHRVNLSTQTLLFFISSAHTSFSSSLFMNYSIHLGCVHTQKKIRKRLLSPIERSNTSNIIILFVPARLLMLLLLLVRILTRCPNSLLRRSINVTLITITMM